MIHRELVRILKQAEDKKLVQLMREARDAGDKDVLEAVVAELGRRESERSPGQIVVTE
jgi:hypothetical protein